MEKKFSKEYKVICRFFKEIGLYHEFIIYQKEANKHFKFHCQTIPCNTHNLYEDFASSSITIWIEKVYGVTIMYSLYEVFIIWVREVYMHKFKCLFFPKPPNGHDAYVDDIVDDIIDKKSRKIMIENLILRK